MIVIMPFSNKKPSIKNQILYLICFIAMNFTQN